MAIKSLKKKHQKKQQIRIGTFNIQGGNSKIKKIALAEDMERYHITAIATTETKISTQKDNVQTLTSLDGKMMYSHYLSGSKNTKHGVGIIVRSDMKCTFVPVNDRLCKLTIKKEQSNIVIISAYAPTLELSIKQPEKSETFYDELESLIHTVKARDFLIIAGDFNAKTGSAYKKYKTVMGRFGKGELNENGTELLDFCLRNELILTNTTFQHKINNRTTWQSLATSNRRAKDGELRRNPVRNQIDYIILRKCHINKISDCRSYSGTQTRSDHRLVLATVNEAITPRKCQFNVTKLHFTKLHDTKYAELYKNAVLKRLETNKNNVMNQQERWDNIVKANQKASEQILTNKNNNKRYSTNSEIIRLSKEQKDLNARINNSKNDPNSSILRTLRNQKLTKIHNLLKTEEAQRLSEEITQ